MGKALSKFVLLVAIAFISGCSTTKTTTTERTAVELALISATTETVIDKFESPELEGKTFFVDKADFEAVDKNFILAELQLRLLRSGMSAAADKDTADIVVTPRSAVVGIDDDSFLFGVPAIPIPVPTVGVISTPELALYKRVTQIGRAKLGVYGIDRATGSLAFDMPLESANHYYNRYIFLLFFSWDRTDMMEPYNMVHDGIPITVAR